MRRSIRRRDAATFDDGQPRSEEDGSQSAVDTAPAAESEKEEQENGRRQRRSRRRRRRELSRWEPRAERVGTIMVHLSNSKTPN